MHTIDAKDHAFNFNQDMSGDVIIVKPDGETVEVNGDALVSFFIQLDARKQYAELQEALQVALTTKES